VSHRVVRVEHGQLRIDQHLRMSSRETGTDVSGPTCIYARVRVTRGRIAYLHGDTRVPAPRSFAVFLPPFTIVQAVLDRCDVASVAVAFRPLASDRLPPRPILLSTSGERLPRSRQEVLDRLRAADAGTDISRTIAPASHAARGKTIIDSEYATSLGIGGIAARLQKSPAVLSRAFKEAYGMPPVRYRHHVRIMDALMQLAEGAVPAQVFQEVGFDDLSRFYKIFRKVACAAPGSYRPVGSRNAKT
jgi:AraC-like DNA-binding protein